MKVDLKSSEHLIREIENLKANLSALEQSKRQLELDLQQVSEKSWTGNWELNLQTKEVLWNNHMFELLDVKKDTIPNMQLFNDRLNEIDRDKLNGAIRRTFLTLENYSFEHDIVLENRVYHVRTDLHMELDGSKKPIKLIGITNDITSIKTAQKELEKLSLVASKTLNAVVVMKTNTEIEWVNEGFIRMTGYRLNEVKGKSFSELLGDKRIKWVDSHEMFQRLNQNHAINEEATMATKQWRNLWTLINITPILDYELKPVSYIAIISDIDKRKQDEKLLLQQKHEIEQKNKILHQTINELAREKIGRKALLITFLVGIILLLTSEIYIDPLIDQYMEGDKLLTISGKIIIAAALKPIEDGVRRKMMRDAVKRRHKPEIKD